VQRWAGARHDGLSEVRVEGRGVVGARRVVDLGDWNFFSLASEVNGAEQRRQAGLSQLSHRC
jgi:hypothetical protein